MIIAITGGTGFIGRQLVLRHLARGDEVRILSRRSPPEVGLAGSARWVNGDLAGNGDLGAFVDGADVLYHCAGELRDEAKMPALHVEGTRRLITAASGRTGRWVQLSSVGVYGRPRRGLITEQSPTQPQGVYETTKKESDDLVQAAGDAGAFDWTILRPSIVFGEGMPNQSLFQMIRIIDRGHFFFIGRPGASANYIHVDNVANALALCAVSPAAPGAIFNLSDYATLETFVGMIANALGKPRPTLRLPESLARPLASVAAVFTRRFPLTGSRIDAMTTRACYPIDAIQGALGYRHEVSLEAGVLRLVHSWATAHKQSRLAG